MIAENSSAASLGGVKLPQERDKNSFAPARLARTLRMALRSLWLHRLRSLLTVLGSEFRGAGTDQESWQSECDFAKRQTARRTEGDRPGESRLRVAIRCDLHRH